MAAAVVTADQRGIGSHRLMPATSFEASMPRPAADRPRRHGAISAGQRKIAAISSRRSPTVTSRLSHSGRLRSPRGGHRSRSAAPKPALPKDGTGGLRSDGAPAREGGMGNEYDVNVGVPRR
ncbi:hypothetical protein GCM10009608_48780 [Pseudonocardia alaniniphila]